MPPFVPLIVWGIAIPFVAGTAVLILGGRRAASAPIALGAAVAAAHAGLLGVPRFPAGDSVAWLFWIALGGGIAGLLESAWRAPLPLRLAIRLALAEALFFTLLRQPYLLETWTGGEAAAYMAGLGAVAVALWTALDLGGERLPGARLPFLLCVLAMGAAVVLGLTGSASLGILAGALAAACGPALILAWLGRPATLSPGGTATFALILSALLVDGRFFSDTPASSALLLAAAPLAALAGARFAGEGRGLKRTAFALGPGLLAIAGAVAIAVGSF